MLLISVVALQTNEGARFGSSEELSSCEILHGKRFLKSTHPPLQARLSP